MGRRKHDVDRKFVGSLLPKGDGVGMSGEVRRMALLSRLSKYDCNMVIALCNRFDELVASYVVTTASWPKGWGEEEIKKFTELWKKSSGRGAVIRPAFRAIDLKGRTIQ